MSTECSQQLTVLDRCSKAVSEAERLDELTDLRSRAEAIRIWAKSANESLEVQNRAAELRLRAERKAGKMLSQLKLKGGNRRPNGRDDRLKLADLGVNQNQSKRWQRMAAIPDQQFSDYVRSCALLGKEITAAGLLRVSIDGGRGRARKKETHVLRTKVSVQTHPCRDDGAFENFAPFSVFTSLESIEEAMNHVKLLRQVLGPYALEETVGLSKGERRAALYLLSEITELLQRVCRSALQPRGQS